MNKLELLKEIMNLMEPEMSHLGFKKTFSRQMFIKDKDQDFVVAYSLSAIDRFNMSQNKAGVVFEPAIFIHNKQVEKIYSRITTREVEHVLNYKTIGNILADLIANPSGRYEVRNQSLDLFLYAEKDIVQTAKVLMDYFKEFVLPYLERYATWKGLNEIFNSNLSYNTVHCNIEPERSIRGLIVAKLIDRKNLNELIRIHSERIRSMSNENYIIELNRLFEIFDSIVAVEITVNYDFPIYSNK